VSEQLRNWGVQVQAQMSGRLPLDHRVLWRSHSGLQYRSLLVESPGIRSNFKPYDNPNMPAFNATVDLSRGFYEDGPWGPVKLTKNNGFSTAMLAWAMLDAKEAFHKDRDLAVRTHPWHACECCASGRTHPWHACECCASGRTQPWHACECCACVCTHVSCSACGGLARCTVERGYGQQYAQVP
jgi:hypothetical protein